MNCFLMSVQTLLYEAELSTNSNFAELTEKNLLHFMDSRTVFSLSVADLHLCIKYKTAQPGRQYTDDSFLHSYIINTCVSI